MADEDILNLTSAPDAGAAPESPLAPSASAEHSVVEIVEAAVAAEPAVLVEPAASAEPAETTEITRHASPSVATAGNGKSWSHRPLPVSKRRSGGQAVRHGNYGMTPRRFVTLRESDPKPVLAAPVANQEGSEARAARGVRRALWIIAIATALNVGVAGLQWYELHRTGGPTHSVDAASTVNRASLP